MVREKLPRLAAGSSPGPHVEPIDFGHVCLLLDKKYRVSDI
jgi:hypothetical protein